MVKLYLLFFNCLILFSLVSCETEKDDINKDNNSILKNTAVIVHAGGSYGPQNSLKSIKQSMELNVDAVEIDVRLSKDGKLLLSHDEAIDTGKNGIIKINDLTYEQLSGYFLKNPDGSLSSEKIPTLEMVIDLVNGKIPLLLEIKDYSNDVLIAKLAKFIQERNLYSCVMVSSFSHFCLRKMHQLDPDITYQYLLNRDDELDFLCSDDTIISTITIECRSFSKDMVERIHNSGKKINIYTLNSLNAISSDLYSSVDGIITDYPVLWLNIKNGM